MSSLLNKEDKPSQSSSTTSVKIIFDQVLAKVPSFKQAMFSFEAKAGVFGPVSYWDEYESLRQGLEEDGCWFVNKESGSYEFRSDCDDSIEHGFEYVHSFDVGSAVAEILNNNNELLVKALFGEKSAFSNGNSLTYGVLEVSIVPQESSLEVGEDDLGRSCYLSKGFRGFAASFRSADQVSNAVVVP